MTRALLLMWLTVGNDNISVPVYLKLSPSPMIQGSSADGGVPWHVVVDESVTSDGLTNGELRASPLVVIVDGGSINVSGSVSVSNLPATQPVSGTFWPVTQPVSGSVSVSNLPVTQPVSGTFFQATQPVSIATMPSTPVTGTFWPATQPVSGSVSVSNFPATQPVSIASMPSTPVTGAFFQATQPVSGAFFQATQPVSLATAPTTPVTGTFWQATQPISGSVSVSNFPGTQAVSGPVTDTQLRASPVPVSGTFFQATQPVSIASMPSTPVTGAFFQATQPVSVAAVLSTNDAASATNGAAIPGKAMFVGVREGANLTGLLQCDKTAPIVAAAVATTQIVALSGSTVIYVCGFSMSGGGAAGTLTWKYGTGVNCATGPVNLSGSYTTAIGSHLVFGGGPGYVMKTTAGQALCITMATAAATANGILSYAQF